MPIIEVILGSMLAVSLVYWLIPDFLLHLLGWGTYKRHYGPGIALTFDDGPDPRYTPRILDILARYGVKATFFVVAEKAITCPELVRRMQAEGHQIGLHGSQHLHAWTLNPSKTWRVWQDGLHRLEEQTGQRITWIRPPWGSYNLSLWAWLLRTKRRAVMWTAEGQDWLKDRQPQQIAQRILKRAKPGITVLLHDAGGQDGAPENTIQALDILCTEILERKRLPIAPPTFPEWSWGRRMVYRIWEGWERIYASLHQIEGINEHNILRLCRKRYRGPSLYSEEGQVLVQAGDWVGEIHFDNDRLSRTEKDQYRMGLTTLRQTKESLKELAQLVSQKTEYQGLKAFTGFTLINRGAAGLGFHVKEVPNNPLNQFTAFFQRIILWIYHPVGRERAKQERHRLPKLIWMTREELLTKWLTQEKSRLEGNGGLR